jgi:ribonuclease HI
MKMIKLNKDQARAIKNAAELDGLSIADRKTLIKMIDVLNGEDQATVKLFVDGASDLHSKTAGIGGVIYSNDQELSNFSEPLFNKTNNEAEYLALIKGIEKLIEIKVVSAEIYADSELVVKQVLGIYKVKNERMKILHNLVLEKLKLIDQWNLVHIRREKNIRADELSKLGMNKAKSQK